MIVAWGLCLEAQAREKERLSSIDIILQESEDSIDVGAACLSLAQEFYPDLNTGVFLSALDDLAFRFQQHFGHVTDPEQKLRALNTFL